MRKGRKKLNQQGMTLVELIVVILIIGILSAGTLVGASYINSMNAASAAEKLNSLLNRTRVLSTSASGSVKLELSADDNGFYGKIMQDTTEIESVTLGNQNLTINVMKGAIANPMSSGSSFDFSYKKENGAFSDAVEYTSVVITGSKTKTIRLVHDTGRSYIE